MTNQTDNIGVRAFWDNTDFAKGNVAYVNKLLQSNRVTSQATDILSGLGITGGAGLSAGMVAGAAGVGLLVVGIGALIKAASAAVTTLTDIAVESAPLVGIGTSFEAMAGRFNVSLDAMRMAASGTISDFELMRNANIALTGAGQDLGEEFGAKLPKLLEGARLSARATGQSVDFLFQSLVTGIKRGSPLLIDNTGLVISQTEAQQKLAEELGISTGELTEQQRQIALLNATVAAIDEQIAAFGNQQLTAAENMARVTAETQNVRDMLGIALQPALQTVTGAWANLVAGMSESIREGGALQDLFVKIGAVASIMADGIAAAADLVGQAMNFILDYINSIFSESTANAFEWGVDLITEFAKGIIDAAASVLASAMQAITNLLTSWLMPQSPPKVAPDLDKWGMGAIFEYLKGMTEADFGVLNDLQRPLKDALSFLEQTGGIAEGAAGGIFADISKGLIEGLQSGDIAGALEKMRSAAGDFGDELVELARAQLDLASAVDQVASAEERLKKAQEEEIKASQRVMKATLEYNQALRAGTDPSLLRDKLALVRAAQDSESAAIAEREASEKNLQTAKDREQAAADQVSALKDAVSEMLELARSLLVDAEQQEKAKAGGAALGSSLAGGLGAGLSTGMEGITTMLTEKVEAMKAQIKEKLLGLWDEVKERWQLVWGDALALLQEKWDALTAAFKQFYDERIQPIWEKFVEWNQNAVEAVGLFWEKIQEWQGWMEDTFKQTWEWFQTGLEAVVGFLGDMYTALKDKLFDKMKTWVEDILTPLAEVLETIEDWLSQVVNWLWKMGTAIANMPALTDFTQHSPAPLEAGLAAINEEMNRLVTTNLPKLVSATQMVNNAGTGTGFSTVTTNATNNQNLSLQMTNNVNGPVDVAMIEGVVRRVITSSMRRV